MKLVRLFLLFILINVSLTANERDVIKLNDAVKLEKLFFSLIEGDNFGYTLFGDKPVSLGGAFVITPWQNFIELGQTSELFWDCWKCWEKYKKNLKFTNYMFVIEEDIINSDQSYLVKSIYFINKKELKKTIINHLDFFETILQKKIDPDIFIADIEKGKNSFSESINNNQALLGLCLGYGKQNSILFTIKDFILKEDALGYFYIPKRLRRISSLGFRADLDSAETKLLIKKYEKWQGNLSEIYANGNFFEVSLKQLLAE
ncbi:hypothetical protein BN1013_01608 [Candidatus Rubidus massiliensis]|nr:hypothetical protein BN1013_01608 [Candidatus Rubidus massiliensis]